MKTTEVKDIDKTFVENLRSFNIENNFKNTKLPLNEDDKVFDRQLKDINNKKTVRKLHDAGWKKFHFC